MAPELILNLWHTLLKIPQMTALSGIVILNEEKEASTNVIWTLSDITPAQSGEASGNQCYV